MSGKRLDWFGGLVETPINSTKVHAKRIGGHAIFVFRTEFSCDFTDYFLRMIEFYGWSLWSGSKRALNRDEFVKWFTITHSGKTYDEQFYGMFISHNIVMDFFRTHLRTGLTMEERELLGILTSAGCVSVDGSRIRKARGIETHMILINEGLCNVDGFPPREALMHELSHFLFDTRREYASKVRGAYRSMGGEYRRRVKAALLAKEYAEDNIPDEWAAMVVGEQGNMQRMSYKLDDDTRARINGVRRIFRSEIKKMEDFYATEEVKEAKKKRR